MPTILKIEHGTIDRRGRFHKSRGRSGSGVPSGLRLPSRSVSRLRTANPRFYGPFSVVDLTEKVSIGRFNDFEKAFTLAVDSARESGRTYEIQDGGGKRVTLIAKRNPVGRRRRHGKYHAHVMVGSGLPPNYYKGSTMEAFQTLGAAKAWLEGKLERTPSARGIITEAVGRDWKQVYTTGYNPAAQLKALMGNEKWTQAKVRALKGGKVQVLLTRRENGRGSARNPKQTRYRYTGALELVWSPMNVAWMALWGRGPISTRQVLKIFPTLAEAREYARLDLGARPLRKGEKG